MTKLYIRSNSRSIVEKVVKTEASGKNQISETEFYLPHRPVIHESAETTKLRIAFIVSAKTNNNTVSLSYRRDTGLRLKNAVRHNNKIAHETYYTLWRHRKGFPAKSEKIR